MTLLWVTPGPPCHLFNPRLSLRDQAPPSPAINDNVSLACLLG